MKKQEWYANHACCPKCGELKIVQTTSAIVQLPGSEFTDETNKATCPICGWKGMVKQLKPDPNATRDVQKMQVQLRTMDKDNNVYVSTEDCVATIRNFGSELISALKDEQTITYTENLLTEILKIFIGTDITHRTAKAKEQMRIQNEQFEITDEKTE